MKLSTTIAALCMGAIMVAPLAAAGAREAPTAARPPRPAAEILGAGATFPAPLMTAWADEYRTVSGGTVAVNYQSVGSGAGVRQFNEQTIMFGATEAFLNDENMARAVTDTGGRAFNMPVTLGDVVLIYNLPGVRGGLVFNPETLAGAFLGEITRWNDPRIARLNPGVNLPNLPLQIAHRSDSSGTTNIFTNYVSKVSPTWRERVGFGTSVSWPVGTGGRGNEGVAAFVTSTPGALGYVSLVYAVLNNITFASLVNRAGRTIAPSFQATSRAAAVQIPPDARVMITDTAAPDGYPIAGFVWVLLHENMERNRAITNRTQAEEMVRFLYWVITEGQNMSEGLSFARLPADAQAVGTQMLSSLKFQGENVGQRVIEDVRKNGF